MKSANVAVMSSVRTVSPVDGRVVVERPFATETELSAVLSQARSAQKGWSRLSIQERGAYLTAFVDAMLAGADEAAREITLQMGRPISQTPGELRGFEQRARHMIGIAESSLARVSVPPQAGFTRYVERTPHGVLLSIAPWNYPYLTAVNSVVPALMAGNVVVLKHSPQTPLCAERFAEAFAQAGLPQGTFQFIHCSNELVERAVQSPELDAVVFTGSVAGGKSVQQAAGGRFIPVGLELGGKDPAYVREDVQLEHAIENLVDGAFFNSGQSCCAIERIYVHRARYAEFVEGFVALTKQYRLGDPTLPETNLGPMVSTAAASFVQSQVDEAVAQGAQPLISQESFTAHAPGTPYLAPQVLVEVNHRMRLMHEESFGPVVGIMPVESDEEAVALMNDSRYGLTASVWTQDEARAVSLGREVQTGTWFMNRCDALDPALAWSGIKDSGRGCSLSRLSYEALTHPKSFHLRTAL